MTEQTSGVQLDVVAEIPTPADDQASLASLRRLNACDGHGLKANRCS